ncbi:MAG: CPBP family intramembrane metalloprotease [Clostridia bacterium]|nr:CPBP family intramembrane metalloprotease [Clostridia bacterium]
MKIKSTFMAPLLCVVVTLMLAASHYLDLDRLALRSNASLAVIVLQLLIIVVPTVFYIKLRGEGFPARMRIAPFGMEKLLVTLLAAVTLILGDLLLKLALYRLGLTDGAYTVYDSYLEGRDPGLLYAIFTYCIVPSVAEELLFRSVLCAEYEPNGVLTAVIGSSLLYGMFSMNFGYFAVYVLAGLIFALVLYLTRSVLASMLCHFIYSLFEMAASETLWKLISKPQSTAFLIFAAAGLFLLCLVSLFSECERIYGNYALQKKSSDYCKACPRFSPRLFAEALLAPPYLVAGLVFIVAAIEFM